MLLTMVDIGVAKGNSSPGSCGWNPDFEKPPVWTNGIFRVLCPGTMSSPTTSPSPRRRLFFSEPWLALVIEKDSGMLGAVGEPVMASPGLGISQRVAAVGT